MPESYEATKPGTRREDPPGIVIQDRAEPLGRPVIAAFIWGGKVRPVPTLPFGRWKKSAA
ncbi:MAG TPA: hypothetical protein VKZ58_03505 [Longimicrobiales bacterium]|nr:hypothetical protein [Longimicrobiales bacterium]